MSNTVGVHRSSLLQNYVTNQVQYLSTIYPHMTHGELRSQVENIVKTRVKRPQATIINHPCIGKSELQEVDLLTHTRMHSHRIITPSGTILYSTDEKIAFDKHLIDDLRNGRDQAKRAMLKYKALGDEGNASQKKDEQATKKIRVNSIIGSNGNDQNAMYDKEAFNGVTSMARYGIISAYAYTERFLVGNYYFPDMETLINFIVTTAVKSPDAEKIERIAEKYNLRVPEPSEFAKTLVRCLHNYCRYSVSHFDTVTNILANLPRHQYIFVIYSRCLYRLFTFNSNFWKNWLDDFFNTRNQIRYSDYCNIDPSNSPKLDGDLLQVMATVHEDLLSGIQIKDALTKDNDLARQLIHIGALMKHKLEDIKDIVDVFLHSDALISHIHHQRNIIRKCVAISDTDSVIFTTVHLLTWYLNGKFRFSPETYNVNALIVYFLTKSIGSFIRKMTIARGATGDNINIVEMKNEYMYPVLLKTALGKHYAGTYTIQEGNVLPKPTLDIKGVSFMSSKIPSITHQFTKSLFIDIQKDMLDHCEIDLEKYIIRVYDYEQTIQKSLLHGEFTYFPNETIRQREEYAKPESSIYTTYEFWKAVFAPDYGDISIPNKVPMIPIHGKKLRSPTYLAQLQSMNPNLHDRLVDYLATLPKNKTINRIPLPPVIAGLPRELTPVLRLRNILYQNTSAAQLVLKSIGLDLGFQKKCPLLSDIYSFTAI